MKVLMQSPNRHVTHRLDAFVHSQLIKLQKFYAPIIEAQVCLKVANVVGDERSVCEVRLVIPGNDLFASKISTSFEEAARLTIEALKHQIDRLKTNWERRRVADRDDEVLQSL